MVCARSPRDQAALTRNVGDMGSRRLSLGSWSFVLACAVLIAIKMLFDLVPQAFPARGQGAAFTWQALLVVIALGAAGLFAERALRLPQAGENRKRDRAGLLWALTSGVAYGLITIAKDLYDRSVHATAQLSSVHMALPWSIPFYLYGAIFLEMFLRLGCLCVLVWLISSLALRGKAFATVFWLVNCVVALYEILPYTLQHIARQEWLAVAATPLEPLYFSNVFEGWLLLRFGWVTPVIFRIAFYAVWHVLYGGIWHAP